MHRATVTSASPLLVTPHGSTAAVPARCIDSYSPTVNAEVVVARFGGQVLCLGTYDIGFTGGRALLAFTALTLANLWAAKGAPWATPSYAIDGSGVVHLKGVLNGASATATSLGTLPAGFRPAAQVLFAIPHVNTAGTAWAADSSLAINTSGLMTYQNLSGANVAPSYMLLDSISFPTT